MSTLAETRHLVQKQARQNRQPFEVLLGAILATVVFAAVYLALVFRLRHDNAAIAWLIGPGLCGLLCIGLALVAVIFYHRQRPVRAIVVFALAVLTGLVAGVYVGQQNWNRYMMMWYNYQDMGSYVNVDPGVDVGQSFMDAGHIYFKDGSYVLQRKGLAFHNGATYCVAPIVRQPVQMMPGQSNPFVLATATGFAVPLSGTIDFWAVGVDCCGTTGTDAPFTCGDAQSHIARSGARLLNNAERENYLLAVKEWSASAGLPVRHPQFFKWVKDPIKDMQTYYHNAWSEFWLYLFMVFICALILCFVLMFLLQKVGFWAR
mmetsp:Transcript_20558/g.57095  ORF Transcript_20558/g.57095 Transcript_20558/m.57095 type:complete len:318 (+) Transcript_20558:60-1013(+)